MDEKFWRNRIISLTKRITDLEGKPASDLTVDENDLIHFTQDGVAFQIQAVRTPTFTVVGECSPHTINHDSGANAITITGTGFSAGMAVEVDVVDEDITISAIALQYVSSTELKVHFNVEGEIASPTTGTITLTKDGYSASPVGFHITMPLQILSIVTSGLEYADVQPYLNHSGGNSLTITFNKPISTFTSLTSDNPNVIVTNTGNTSGSTRIGVYLNTLAAEELEEFSLRVVGDEETTEWYDLAVNYAYDTYDEVSATIYYCINSAEFTVNRFGAKITGWDKETIPILYLQSTNGTTLYGYDSDANRTIGTSVALFSIETGSGTKTVTELNASGFGGTAAMNSTCGVGKAQLNSMAHPPVFFAAGISNIGSLELTTADNAIRIISTLPRQNSVIKQLVDNNGHCIIGSNIAWNTVSAFNITWSGTPPFDCKFVMTNDVGSSIEVTKTINS